MHPLTLSTLFLLPVLIPTALTQGTGQATFYGGNLNGGACSFSTYSLPSNILGTALAAPNWSNSGNCGACVRVTGPNGHKITAMVVDECPECPQNGLDLFQNAFGQLSPLNAGRISVKWEYVTCPISSPLQVHLKEGVSAYWFSAQIVNANKAVRDLQVSADGGRTWIKGLQRKDYNFFERSSGTGSNTVAVKAISTDGDEVVVKNVQVSSNKVVSASRNFGSGKKHKKHAKHHN